MHYLLALFPILLVLWLMVRLRWGVHQAGPVGWLATALLAWITFGLTGEIVCISQAKGLLLSFFVLAVMWPALFLYHWNDQNGGIKAVAALLEDATPHNGVCLILLAWILSGMLEGLAGFGLPIAIMAPMLVSLGVKPLRAVAAVAIGHSWAVTFGSMGVILETLAKVVDLDPAKIIPWAGLLLGVACIGCGLLSASILGQLRHWPLVVALSIVMSATQYAVAAVGLLPLSAFGAGLAGLTVYLLLAAKRRATAERFRNDATRSALFPLFNYGALTLLMAALTLIAPLRVWSQKIAWTVNFPEVRSLQGHVTAATTGQVFRPLSHPGTLTLAVTCVSLILCMVRGTGAAGRAKRAAFATWKSAAAASVGVISMVGLSTFMEHCGMSYLLADGLSRVFGAAYPVVSPCVGILGAIATGSNNNSNVLFGTLQKNAALMLGIPPELMVAAQTAGGSLGSMLAPVKLILGCSTVGQIGKEGQVLRTTVPWGLGLGILLGVLTYLLSRL